MAPRPLVLIRSAAGPRLGYGHLVRARTLAGALDADVRVSVRGGRAARRCATRMGLVLAPSSTAAALAASRPALLVIDDPNLRAGAAALAAARARHVPAASVHDLGRSLLGSDLVIDGSICPPRVPSARACLGPRFAILEPRLRPGPVARHPRPPHPPRVLIALGGGPRVRLAAAIAHAVTAIVPEAQVRVAAGLQAADRVEVHARVAWLGPLPSLAPELRACDVAIVAGGMTLYEACALRVSTIALPVVAAQGATVRAFARRGAILGTPGPARPVSQTAAAVARQVAQVLAAPAAARRRARAAHALVDGRGAGRVAAALRSLITGGPAVRTPAHGRSRCPR